MSRYLFKDEEQRGPPFFYGSGEPSNTWKAVRHSQSAADGPRTSTFYPEDFGSISDTPFTMPNIFSERYTGEVPVCVGDAADVQTPLANACIGVVDFVSKVAITHPCTVLRRQCQVHESARSLHLTPFTFAPVACSLIGNEGIQTLWKGAIGSGMLWTLSTATEVLIAEFFGLPRTVVRYGNKRKFWRHILLKARNVEHCY